MATTKLDTRKIVERVILAYGQHNNIVDAARSAYDDNDTDLLTAMIATAVACNIPVEVVSHDVDEEEFGDPDKYRGSRIATTQRHDLVVDGEVVATLFREGWSHYGSIDHPSTPCGEWTTDSGESDSGVPDAWMAAMEAAGIESGPWEYFPEAEEPPEPVVETDPRGRYCLYWHTALEDLGPLTGERYPTLADARNARDRAEHNLHCRHRGQLLCGYGIAELGDDGEWRQIEEDDD